MSDDNKQFDSDLNGTDNSDLDTDSPSTTQEGEEKHDDLSNEDKANIAEANRQRQIDVWFNRVQNGEITLDQIPENLGWVKSEIQNRLGSNKNTESVSTEDIVKQVLEKERQEEAYKALLGQLRENADDNEFKAVETRYNTLVANGMKDRALALETAIAACGVKIKTEKDIRRQNMAIPRASYYEKPKEAEKINKDASWDDIAGVQDMPADKRSQYYKNLIKK